MNGDDDSVISADSFTKMLYEEETDSDVVESSKNFPDVVEQQCRFELQLYRKANGLSIYSDKRNKIYNNVLD